MKSNYLIKGYDYFNTPIIFAVANDLPTAYLAYRSAKNRHCYEGLLMDTNTGEILAHFSNKDNKLNEWETNIVTIVKNNWLKEVNILWNSLKRLYTNMVMSIRLQFVQLEYLIFSKYYNKKR